MAIKKAKFKPPVYDAQGAVSYPNTVHLETSADMVKYDDTKNIKEALDEHKSAYANQMPLKADKTYVDNQIAINDARIDEIITTPAEGVSAQEIIDARQGKASVGANLTAVKEQINSLDADVYSRGYNITLDSSLVVDNDWTNVIQNALDLYGHILIPTGTYNVNGTINVDDNKTIELGSNTKLEKSINADNENPIIWIRGLYANIRGKGLGSSIFKTNKQSPFGVICVGNMGMSDTIGRDCLYGTIKDIGIIGATTGGVEVGNPSYGLYMAGTGIDSLANYFHTISNIYFRNFNVGLMMEGYVNACLISNLQFWDCGNNKWLDGSAIKLKNTNNKYPLGNTITNIFMHYAWDGDCIFLDGKISYNAIQNIIAEPFGPNCRWLRANSTLSEGNIITGIDNVSATWSIPENFEYKNTIIRRTSFNSRAINVNSATINQDATIKKLSIGNNLYNLENSFFTTNLTENTGYTVLKVDIGDRRQSAGYVELEVGLKTANGMSIYRVGKMKFSILINLSGVITINKIVGFSTGLLITEPTKNGSIISFGIKIPNNGTASTVTFAIVKYRIFGSIFSTVTEIADGSETNTSATYPLHYPQSTANGVTSSRPTNPTTGEMFFDTTLGKPIWWNGTVWKDSVGTTV